jgi:competence protein ComEA
MDDAAKKDKAERRRVLLHPGDQQAACLLVVLGFGVVLFSWHWSGVAAGDWVSINRVDGQAAPSEVAFRVDMNSAAWPEFAQLPGIGEELARRIVDERQQGWFVDPDDLQRVRGIGPKILQKIRDNLIVTRDAQ